MLAYKIYGLNNKKIKTFRTEEAMFIFMAVKKISIAEVVIMGISVDEEYEKNVYKINIFEEQDFGNYEYRFKANLVHDTDENGNFCTSWTEDFYTGSPYFPTANQTLKNFIEHMQEEEFDEERDGSPRYSIWDVYSPSELL